MHDEPHPSPHRWNSLRFTRLGAWKTKEGSRLISLITTNPIYCIWAYSTSLRANVQKPWPLRKPSVLGSFFLVSDASFLSRYNSRRAWKEQQYWWPTVYLFCQEPTVPFFCALIPKSQLYQYHEPSWGGQPGKTNGLRTWHIFSTKHSITWPPCSQSRVFFLPSPLKSGSLSPLRNLWEQDIKWLI